MSQVLHPYFSLLGAFDPDEITSFLEREPSLVRRIGDPGPAGATSPRLGAEWIWQPQNDDSDHVEDQLAFLAGALSLKKKEVADLSQTFWGTFHVYTQTEHTWFLSSDTLRLVADLGVHVECEHVSFEEVRRNAD